MITLENFKKYKEFIVVEAPTPLRTFSSAMHNPGYGEYTFFVNRTVGIDYFPEDANEEMRQFLNERNFPLEQTIAMMTAVDMEFAFIDCYEEGETSIVIMVTAGLGNAVDVTKAHQYAYQPKVGTINTFIFINGNLSDEALIQALCCAVEVKTKIIHERGILDHKSGTIATGTSTDSVCVASTQTGEFHQYAGSITKMGTLIGRGLYETMNKAVDSYLAFKKGNQ
ncbi:adenosylcobinamide amidohydrolase [Lysinibacillus antri]|uniref:Iron ABC transporter permease n=1 Tax=Lysinibacillus antri TaxID=2498145 RepID=A0A432LEE8_9BACI|nr:adenosylcobinamide amidohydrolase [Lysinibacillus antri]RUL55144.1 iron ABC transporter permease [Lysinibacillus antri]